MCSKRLRLPNPCKMTVSSTEHAYCQCHLKPVMIPCSRYQWWKWGPSLLSQLGIINDFSPVLSNKQDSCEPSPTPKTPWICLNLSQLGPLSMSVCSGAVWLLNPHPCKCYHMALSWWIAGQVSVSEI